MALVFDLWKIKQIKLILKFLAKQNFIRKTIHGGSCKGPQYAVKLYFILDIEPGAIFDMEPSRSSAPARGTRMSAGFPVVRCGHPPILKRRRKKMEIDNYWRLAAAHYGEARVSREQGR